MKRPLVMLAIAALAVAAVVGMTSTAVGATAAKTKITIQTEADGLSGFVSSPADKCQNNRKVTLYRVSGTTAKAVGSDVAQPNGDSDRWKISVTKSRRYYAQTGKRSGCAVAKSRTLAAQLTSS